MLFLFMFPQFLVHLELLSTDITRLAGSLWLFMWKRHIGQWLMKCVENILRKYWKSQNTFKKQHEPFLIPRQRYKYSRYLLQKEKVYLIGRFSSSTIYLMKNLRSTALYEAFVLMGELRWSFPLLLQWRKRKVKTSPIVILLAF